MSEGIEAIAETIVADVAARRDFRDWDAAALPDMDAAFAVQAAVVERIAATAGGIGGRKIAWNTAAQMQAMGLSEPGAAVVPKDWIRESPARFSAADFHSFTVEPEIAAVLGADLAPRADGWTAESVRAAIDRLLPAFEILDWRGFAGGRPESAIAANVFNAGAVLGGPGAAPAEVDPAELRSRVVADGETLVDAVGGAPMDPFEAAAFLAERFNRLGQAPRAGEVLLLGAHKPPTKVEAPARWTFSLGPLGEVAFEIA